MKFKKNRKYLILIFSFLLLMVPSVHADSDEYEVGFDENTEITWEFTKVNEDLLEEMYEFYDPEYEDVDFDYEEDDELKIKITSIDNEDEDYYELNFNLYENDELVGPSYFKVAKDPDDLAEDWINDENDPYFDYGDSYDLFIILTDTEDYLEEFEETISTATLESAFISASSDSIVINNSFLGREDSVAFEYDDDGILEKMTIVYRNIEILEMELKDVTKDQFNLQTFLIITIVIAIILTPIIIGIVLIIKRRSRKSKGIEKPKESKGVVKPSAIPKTSIPPNIMEKASFCEFCGTTRKTDATFCTSCGNKLN